MVVSLLICQESLGINKAIRGWQGWWELFRISECERGQWETGLNNLPTISVSSGAGLRRLVGNVFVTIF